MAAQRIKTPEMIEQPYLRACNEITQLQMEDAKLRDSVATIRNMIQKKCKDKVCKNCKIFEEQIASLKNHEKERLSFLEDKAARLEEENKVLRQNSNLPVRKDQFYEDNYKTSNNLKLDPQISLYITQLEQKSAYFEEHSKHLQKDLAQRNQQKQQDSIRIINLLDEVQNCKRNFQNMERFYQNQSTLMGQEKERIVYELTSRLKSSQNEINNLKVFLETLNKQKESLQHDLEAIRSQSFSFKRQCEHLNVLLGESQSHLQTVLQQEASKSVQFNVLAQNCSKLKEENISLSYKLAQQTQINLETNKRLNFLQAETANLKQQNFNLLSKSTQLTDNSQEISYLTKLLQQNKLILDSKEGQIQQMNHQIDCLKRENQSLNDCIKNQYSTIEKAERISAFQSDAIRSLERQRQNMTQKLMSLQAERNDWQQSLKIEVFSKAEITQRLIKQAQMYGEINKKYHNLYRQLQELRKSKIQPKDSTEYKVSNQQIVKLQQQKDILYDQVQSLRSNNQAKQIQIGNLNHELQLITAAKHIQQKDIEAKQKEIDQLIHFNNQMYSESQRLKNENTNFIDRIRQFQSIIYQLQQDNKVLASHNDELRKQKKVLSQLAENLQREKQSLIRQKQSQEQISLQQQLRTFQTKLTHAKIENAEKQRLFETERQTNILLLNHKKQLEALNSQLISQNNRLKQRENQLMNQIQQQLSLKWSQTNNLKSDLRQKNEKKDHNFNQTQLDLIHLQELYDENLSKYEKLAESERIANQNIIYLREKLESMKKVYSQQIDSKEHQQLLKELNKKKQTITELLTNFKYLQKTLNKKEAQFDSLTQEHKKYCKQVQKQRFEMNEKLSQRQKQINTLKKQRDQQSRQIASKMRDMQKQIHNLQDQSKLKQKAYSEDKRKLEKEFAVLSEEKRKRQQSTARQIINIKQTLQTQKKRSMETSLNNSPVKGDDSKKKQKQIESLKKNIIDNGIKLVQLQKQLNQKQSQLNKLKQQWKTEQELMRETNEHFSQTSVHLDVKEKQLQQALSNNKRLIEEINTVKLQLSKKNIQLERIKQQMAIKQKQHSLLQQNIRSIELKYQQLNKETTQKNLAYDYQWMQLDESKKKIHNIEKQLNENKKYLENIKQKSQDLKDSQNPCSLNPSENALLPVPDISGGMLPLDSDRLIKDLNIKHVQSFTEPLQTVDLPASQSLLLNKLSLDEIPSSSIQTIYLANEDMPRQGQKIEIPNKNEKEVYLEGEIKQVQKKSATKNLILQQTLSDAVSDAQQNDEINQILANKDYDHRSHKQLSVQEFSEYSRIKSTKSELNHKQVEEQYKNHMKNAKMLSKLSKPAKKQIRIS